MHSADQVLLFAEILVFVILMLQVLLRWRTEDAEEYLVIYLGLSVIPTLLWLTQLTVDVTFLPSPEIISVWARIVPVVGFSALTMAFVHQTRYAVGWLLGGVGLFAVLVTLQLGVLPQIPQATTVVYAILWTLALSGATIALLLTYRQRTSPLHRNRLRYWLVVLALLVAAEGVSLVTGFSARIANRALNWAAAGMATYVVLQVHPPDLKTLARQGLRLLALTLVLGVALFGILIAVQTARWTSLSRNETILLTGVVAIVTAFLLPVLWNLSQRTLGRLLFGADYDAREVVRHYSQSVSNILDIDRLAAIAFEVVCTVFDAERGAMLLVQNAGEGRSTVLPIRGRGDVPTHLGEVETFGILMNQFGQSGSPITQYDIDVLPAYRNIPDSERQWLNELKVELYVPIRSQGEVIGLLALGPKRSGESYRQDDLNLLSTLADQTVAALNNAKLVQDLRRLNLDVSRLNTELSSMNRTKTDFINIASHELRTPLSQISGYSQILGDELASDSSLINFVEGLIRGSKRLTEIVDVMLDVSQLDAGVLILHRTPVPISQAVEKAVDEWRSALEERGHSLEIDDLEALPPVEGDEARLQQIFKELISNAIKSTPDGGRIEIRGRTHTRRSGQYVEVTVTDNGIGIDPEDQYKIFDKFYRTGDLMKHSTGKAKFKGAGTGLGLSLVKGIVDAHGGRIWVESPGHDEKSCPGSSFHVLLPLRPSTYNPTMAKTMISPDLED
jgi:signal transduction histidine kinase